MTQRTQYQSPDDHERSRQLSLQGTRPPTDVPGYEPQRILGSGAFGEVWIALDHNTGRRVAIKFYTHRGGLDWTQLSREVEKLAFLSADRYVVQLYDVGWNAEPPYYVMEYLERGSLDDLITRDGPLPAAAAVALFREIAVGLLHAHGKGVLHCDLKPANVLLDQDSHPRLADFGQSRMSHEQTPALGTLFYMAPEQADLKALPDARWDVYALGAVLYTMLTGAPPYQTGAMVDELRSAPDLESRLAMYRHAIRRAAAPQAHRHVAGVDRALAEVVDRALAPDPNKRFANVQAVLDALAVREERKARRPLVVLGALGPALVLLVAAIFAWQWFATVVDQSDRSLTTQALEGNQFAAQFVARAASDELGRRYRAVEQVADDRDFQSLLRRIEADPQLKPIREQLSDPALDEESPAAEALRQRLAANPLIVELQKKVTALRDDPGQPYSASWLVNDSLGLQLARAPQSRTIGRNYAWRTYFSGATEDRTRDWRPGASDHLKSTHLSAAFLSQASGQWTVSISTPVFEDAQPDKRWLGVVGLSVDVGSFVELRGDRDRFGVLVDLRDGPNRGLVLQHPIYDEFREQKKQPLPPEVSAVRLSDDALPQSKERSRDYVDPFGTAMQNDGAAYRRHWLAAMVPVTVRQREKKEMQDTGWRVIVQQAYEPAIGEPLERLRLKLVASGLLAMALATAALTALWVMVLRGLRPDGRHAATIAGTVPPSVGPTPDATMATLPDLSALAKRKPP
ncbi:MAG: protein kinase [Planctomycetia bacterium]|nr:protein kinase [Planctomycetia bacterium]